LIQFFGETAFRFFTAARRFFVESFGSFGKTASVKAKGKKKAASKGKKKVKR